MRPDTVGGRSPSRLIVEAAAEEGVHLGLRAVLPGEAASIESFDQDVTFQYATENGSAAAPGDYTTTTGTGVIQAGSLSTTIYVPVVGDMVAEPDESFVVNITNIVGAVGSDIQGQATITNDDLSLAGIPTLSQLALALMAMFLAVVGTIAMRS